MNGQTNGGLRHNKGVLIIVGVIVLLVLAGLFYKLGKDPEDTAAMLAETPSEAAGSPPASDAPASVTRPGAPTAGPTPTSPDARLNPGDTASEKQ